MAAWRDDKSNKFAQLMEDLQREEQKALEKEVQKNKKDKNTKQNKKTTARRMKETHLYP